jgi:DNA-binding PadR family transcriptional regulator
MPRDALSLFSYEILGLVGARQGAGPHDLGQLARRGRTLACAGERQYYLEPKRLTRLGYLTACPAPGQTHPRTVYTLTDAGLQTLRDGARAPVRFVPFKGEAMVPDDHRPHRRDRHAREHGQPARRPRRSTRPCEVRRTLSSNTVAVAMRDR